MAPFMAGAWLWTERQEKVGEGVSGGGRRRVQVKGRAPGQRGQGQGAAAEPVGRVASAVLGAGRRVRAGAGRRGGDAAWTRCMDRVPMTGGTG